MRTTIYHATLESFAAKQVPEKPSYQTNTEGYQVRELLFGNYHVVAVCAGKKSERLCTGYDRGVALAADKDFQ